MEGLGQVVVGSIGKAAHNLVCVRYAGQYDDVGVRRLKVPAYALAQFKSGDVRHHPICNQQSRLMLRKELDRLKTTLREQHTVLFLGKSALNKFAINPRVVLTQDREFWGDIHVGPDGLTNVPFRGWLCPCDSPDATARIHDYLFCITESAVLDLKASKPYVTLPGIVSLDQSFQHAKINRRRETDRKSFFFRQSPFSLSQCLEPHPLTRSRVDWGDLEDAGNIAGGCV